MGTKPVKLLVAYALGQATQLVIHWVTINFSMWDSRRITFCAAAGFIILFAAIAGVFIASDRSGGEHTEPKSYLDWAKIPNKEDVDEVVNPFSANKK